MRPLSMFLLGLLATSALPAMGAEDAAPRQEPVRIAFGALHRLQPGQAFVYELRFPKPRLAGGFPRRVPDREEDFTTRLFRLVVMEPTPLVLGEDVWLRLDTLNGRDEVRTRGLYYIQLGTDEDGRLGARPWDRAMVRGVRFVDTAEVPFVLDYYPSLAVLGAEAGGVNPRYHRAADMVLDWSFSADWGQRVVTVKAHRFYHVTWSGYDRLDENLLRRLIYFDRNSERFLATKPQRERQDVLLVVSHDEETQRWDFGAPLWKHMMRRNHRGVLEFECTLVGRDAIPPENVSERFQKLYRDWMYQLCTRKGADSSTRMDTPLFWKLCNVRPGATDDMFAKLPQSYRLVYVLPYVTRHTFHLRELATAEDLGARRELWENWWERGQAGANRNFEQYYARGDLEAIERQGFAALPKIMEKLEEGHTDLLSVLRWILEPEPKPRGYSLRFPFVRDIPLWPGHMTQEEAADKASRCVSWWERNKEKWLIPFPDQQLE